MPARLIGPRLRSRAFYSPKAVGQRAAMSLARRRRMPGRPPYIAYPAWTRRIGRVVARNAARAAVRRNFRRRR